jgi:hypothetical protein
MAPGLTMVLPVADDDYASSVAISFPRHDHFEG